MISSRNGVWQLFCTVKLQDSKRSEAQEMLETRAVAEQGILSTDISPFPNQGRCTGSVYS